MENIKYLLHTKTHIEDVCFLVGVETYKNEKLTSISTQKMFKQYVTV